MQFLHGVLIANLYRSYNFSINPLLCLSKWSLIIYCRTMNTSDCNSNRIIRNQRALSIFEFSALVNRYVRAASLSCKLFIISTVESSLLFPECHLRNCTQTRENKRAVQTQSIMNYCLSSWVLICFSAWLEPRPTIQHSDKIWKRKIPKH